MTRLIAAFVIAVAGWALWWPVVASSERQATEQWLTAQRAAGWQAEATHIAVTGFPLRYTRTLTAPILADPANGWAWEAERVQLGRPRHAGITPPGLVLTLPRSQTLRSPWQTLDLSSREATATLMVSRGGEAIEEATATLTDLVLRSDAGWDAALQSGTLTARASDSGPNAMRITLAARSLATPSRVAEALSGADLAPREIERIEAEADVTFDAPWTIAALETRRPQPTRLILRDAGVLWGALTLRVAGSLEMDASGEVSGDLLVKATNWRELLATSVASGLIPKTIAAGLEQTLDLMSRLAGRRDTLDVPITFANGRTRIGPLPIAPAPVLRLP